MPTSNKKSSKDYLETESFEVTVVKNPKLKPFLNTFYYSGTNIQQQKSGKIFGIIQVDSIDDSSAYLPNLLTQIVKKEYFKNKNESCGKSLEIALRKLNITLTELTQHGIVKWMNNLNVAIGVICNNEFHFTQIGKGKILLLKKNKVTLIEKDSQNELDHHPMKTFSTISAGKIESEDKLIFTLKETFETLGKEELERHFKTFTSEEFDNILSSTLRNEASNTGLVVVNIKNESCEEESFIAEENPSQAIKEVVNFFGQKNIEDKMKQEAIVPQKKETEERKEENEKIKPINSEKEENQSPFEKEPEIYVKEEEETEEEVSSTEKSNKKIIEIKNIFIIFSKKIFFSTKNKLSNYSFKKLLNFFCSKTNFYLNKNNSSKFKNSSLKILKKIKLPNFKIHKETYFDKLKSIKKSLLRIIAKENYQRIAENFKKIIAPKKEPSHPPENVTLSKVETSNPDPNNFFDRKPVQQNFENKKSKIAKIYSLIKIKIKAILAKEGSKKILFISILAILFLITGIVLSKKMSLKNKAVSIVKQNFKEKTPQVSSNIKNITTLIDLNKEIIDSTLFRNDLFFLTKENSLIKFSIRDNTKTEILLPEELKNPQNLSSMESLQLIFITSEDQVYSYSPVTNSFAKNKIKLPENLEGAGVGTYLTYLYILDKESNQVYRYHRAPGGFGIPKEWLEEEANFEKATDIDISDSVYIAFSDGKIAKYFQNKKINEWSTEEDFYPDKINVKIDREGILALDKKQGKIIELSENNNSTEILQDETFKKSQSFSVDFDNKKIFLVNKNNELLRFDYQ